MDKKQFQAMLTEAAENLKGVNVLVDKLKEENAQLKKENEALKKENAYITGLRDDLFQKVKDGDDNDMKKVIIAALIVFVGTIVAINIF